MLATASLSSEYFTVTEKKPAVPGFFPTQSLDGSGGSFGIFMLLIAVDLKFRVSFMRKLCLQYLWSNFRMSTNLQILFLSEFR